MTSTWTRPSPDSCFSLPARDCSGTIISNAKQSTILARFDPRVVIFLLHGRNSGQQKREKKKMSVCSVGVLASAGW